MKIELNASVGFQGATRSEIMDIDPEEVEGLTETQMENYFYELADDFGHQYLETWFEVIEGDTED
jgi:hypothetical protein